VPNYSAFGERNDSRVAGSSSRNAVSFLSAVTMNLFPLSRCVSATKIVCPLESTVATQPKLHPAFAEVVSDDFPILHSGCTGSYL
jgi:hypothetical protein